MDEAISDAQLHLMYQFDRNDIPTNERIAICHARGVALTIFQWIRSHCIVKGPYGMIVNDLPSLYMIQVLNETRAYKASAKQADIQGAPHCDMKLLERQIENVVGCDAFVKNLWERKDTIRSDTLQFQPKDGFSVEWRAGEGVNDIDGMFITTSIHGLIVLYRTFLDFGYDPFRPQILAG